MDEFDSLVEEFSQVLKADGADAALSRLREKDFSEALADVAYDAGIAQVIEVWKAHRDKAAGKCEPLQYTRDVHNTLISCIKFLFANEKGLYTIQRMTDAARAERFAAIERRLAELERSPLRYDGPHETGKSYTRGTFVTARGSLWRCDTDTAERPGESDAWTLAVKRGQDGRGAR